jgi:hypothetical protein
VVVNSEVPNSGGVDEDSVMEEGNAPVAKGENLDGVEGPVGGVFKKDASKALLLLNFFLGVAENRVVDDLDGV